MSCLVLEDPLIYLCATILWGQKGIFWCCDLPRGSIHGRHVTPCFGYGNLHDNSSPCNECFGSVPCSLLIIQITAQWYRLVEPVVENSWTRAVELLKNTLLFRNLYLCDALCSWDPSTGDTLISALTQNEQKHTHHNLHRGFNKRHHFSGLMAEPVS